MVIEAVDSHPEFKCLINVDLGDSTSRDSPYSYRSATFEYGQHVLDVSSEAQRELFRVNGLVVQMKSAKLISKSTKATDSLELH